MAEFNIALQKTLAYESGYVNDSDDSGGTYKGIIQKHPTNKKYLYGWIIRTLSFHD